METLCKRSPRIYIHVMWILPMCKNRVEEHILHKMYEYLIIFRACKKYYVRKVVDRHN